MVRSCGHCPAKRWRVRIDLGKPCWRGCLTGSLKIWIEVYRDASAQSSARAVKRHAETAAELDVEYGELIRSDEALSCLKRNSCRSN